MGDDREQKKNTPNFPIYTRSAPCLRWLATQKLKTAGQAVPSGNAMSSVIHHHRKTAGYHRQVLNEFSRSKMKMYSILKDGDR